MAGQLTLINEARLKAGKSLIGFFNPALYKMANECPECFNKISSGNNHCSEGQCCPDGFGYEVSATQPFNSVTGLGSFNVAKMIEYMVKL